MLANIDITSNEQFQRKFRYINLIWLGILTIYMGAFVSAVLLNNPTFLHDWHGVTIISLATLMIVIYFIRVRMRDDHWPPRLPLALSVWCSIFLVVTLLSTIDNDFAWCLYMVFGISFTLFSSRRLIIAVCIIMLTLFAYQGLLSQPLSSNALLPIIGQTLAFFSMTLFSMVIQHLIHERYERNELLKQLTEANKELEAAQQQLAESALQEQELAVLRERTRLARDMHDTLGHALVLISVKLEAAQGLRIRDPERCDHELIASREIVRESMKELRASLANLRSPALEREPACQALCRYAREMAQRTQILLHLDLQSDIEALPAQIEETLWKVGQEALTNIEKHADARNTTLHISRQNSSVLMRIQDDGIGMPFTSISRASSPLPTIEELHDNHCSPPEHYGLCGMFERVEGVGGQITIANTPVTGGTTIAVTLPVIAEPQLKSCLAS